MPSVEENKQNWAGWDWSTRGEEWSTWWGDTSAMWSAALRPRLEAMLPCGSILEIAPGYGRWTRYLKDLCDDLVVVDLTAQCIEHCRARFAEATNITYHVNDGQSLAMVRDGSVDLAFSFDSLVHVEPSVIDAYVSQLAAKLTAQGIGFIHHSNAGTVRTLSKVAHRIPARPLRALVRRGVVPNVDAWRDGSMTGALFRQYCAAAGLRCITQELVSWEHGGYLIDAFSVFTRPGSRWDREVEILRNPMFSAEGRRMARLYARSSFAA